MVNNAEWLDELEYIPFLREVGRHFTINRMLTFDSVKLRLDREQPMTFLEFNYMILQAYDFLELSRRAGCRLQIGGSDQWGNIVNGIELAPPDRRDRAVRRHHAADHHRRRREDGQDRAGAVWLDANLLSPYDYWQFWRNADDADVGRSCACSPTCRSTRSRGWKACRAPRSTRRRSCWRPRRPQSSTAATPRKRRGRRLARPSTGRHRRGPADARDRRRHDDAQALTGLGFCASNGEAKRKIAEGAVRLDDQS